MEKELKQFILEIYVDLVEEYKTGGNEDYPIYDIYKTILKIENKLKEII